MQTITRQKQSPDMFRKKVVLRNFKKFTGKHLCQSLFFNNVAGLRPQACNFIKKETVAQVFSCEFCEIFMNTFLYRTPLGAASDKSTFIFQIWKLLQLNFTKIIKSGFCQGYGYKPPNQKTSDFIQYLTLILDLFLKKRQKKL